MSGSSINNLLKKYGDFFDVALYILTANGKISFASDSARCGTFFFYPQFSEQLETPVRIQDNTYLCCIPLLSEKNIYFLALVSSQNSSKIIDQCRVVSISLREILDDSAENRQSMPELLEQERSRLVAALLEEHHDRREVDALLQKMEIDESRLYSVICLQLTFKTNQYFNINLNLGYESQIEKARSDILKTIRENKYFNTRDLCVFYKRNEIVILKSFIDNHDHTRIYMALDQICASIENDLSGLYLLEFKMAYGNVYSDIFQLKSSYKEAVEIISIGHIEHPERSFYNINSILIDSICYSLHPQIIDKIILPNIRILADRQGSNYADLLTCCECFVDCCMNVKNAAEKASIHRNTLNTRLSKLKSLTGLDPIYSFQDALTLKLKERLPEIPDGIRF